MILIDTSIWVDHFRKSEPLLIELLAANKVVIHPFVIGEFIMGNIPSVESVISYLTRLPQIQQVTQSEFCHFVVANKIGGTGIGFVDAHLIAAVSRSRDISIWSRDKRLMDQAMRLNCNYYRE